MKILREEDPFGTLFRKSRYIKRRVYTCDGPNNTWHNDGNDKLKPYGFPIHGCIDGFSRKVLWLKVTRGNKNPVVPASYFLETASKWNLVPDILKTDCGNEKCLMAGIQCKLPNNTDAHRYGSSISNQRIESFWSHFKRIHFSWVIDSNFRKYYSNGMSVVCFFTSDTVQTREVNERMERTQNQEI